MKRKLKTVIIAIMTLCILATSVLSACNPVSPDGDPQDQPPVGEAWVYDLGDLRSELLNVKGPKKIVLKASGNFNTIPREYLEKKWAGETLESYEQKELDNNIIEIRGANNRTIIGEELTNIYHMKLIDCVDVTIENIEFSDNYLIVEGGSYVTVKNCNFTNKGFIRNWLGMTSSEGSAGKINKMISNFTVEGCRFENLTCVDKMYKGAIAIRTFDTITIKNNYFDKLYRDAIRLGEKVHKPQDQRVTKGIITIEGNTFGKEIPGRFIVVFSPDSFDEAVNYVEACFIKDNVFYDNVTGKDEKSAEMAGSWENSGSEQTVRVGQGSVIFYDNYELNIGVNYWENIPTSESNSSYSSNIYSRLNCGYDKNEQLTLDDIVVEEPEVVDPNEPTADPEE
jgi:hypothetical protein